GLARKYQDKVTVTGVSVAENGTHIPAQIEKFVAGMGEKMDYHVAGDATDGYMFKHWVQGAGENSIPFTVIVDGKGKVAWMGTPGGLEKPLQELIAGTYDVRAARQQRIELKTGRAASEAALKKIDDALRTKNVDAAAAAAAVRS